MARSSAVPKLLPPVSPPDSCSELAEPLHAACPADPTAAAWNELAQVALRDTGATGIAIALEEDGTCVCRATAGHTAPALGATVSSASSGLAGECLRTGNMLVCGDSETDARVDADVSRQLGVRSVVTAPLRCDGKSIGLLVALSSWPNAFSESALRAITQLADAAVAVVQGRYRPEHDGPSLTPEPVGGGDYLGSAPSRTSLRSFLVSHWNQHRPLVLVAILLPSLLATLVLLLQSRSHRTGPVSSPVLSENVDQLRQAAEQGDPNSQYRLGLSLYRQEIPQRDDREAVRWLQEASSQGNSDAQYELANVILAQHRIRDAYVWYTAAALRGHGAAQQAAEALRPALSSADVGAARFQLGKMYATGIGLPRDNIAAYSWFTAAQAAGEPRADQARKELIARFSVAEAARILPDSLSANTSKPARMLAELRATAETAATPSVVDTGEGAAPTTTGETQSRQPSDSAYLDPPVLPPTASSLPRLPEPKVALVAPTPTGAAPQIIPGKLIKHVSPRYPDAARLSQIRGDVVLSAHIDEHGKVTSVHVATGHPLLSHAAEAAVLQWVYTPYQLNGKPVDADVTITIRFSP